MQKRNIKIEEKNTVKKLTTKWKSKKILIRLQALICMARHKFKIPFL